MYMLTETKAIMESVYQQTFPKAEILDYFYFPLLPFCSFSVSCNDCVFLYWEKQNVDSNFRKFFMSL
jgi:hypothetical protein